MSRLGGWQEPAAAFGLDDDHAECMADDIVDLPGDARSLVLHGPPGRLGHVTLQPQRPLLKQPLALAAYADHPAEHPRHRREQSVPDDAPASNEMTS